MSVVLPKLVTAEPSKPTGSPLFKTPARNGRFSPATSPVAGWYQPGSQFSRRNIPARIAPLPKNSPVSSLPVRQDSMGSSPLPPTSPSNSLFLGSATSDLVAFEINRAGVVSLTGQMFAQSRLNGLSLSIEQASPTSQKNLHDLDATKVAANYKDPFSKDISSKKFVSRQ
jgi:hypothetical protein